MHNVRNQAVVWDGVSGVAVAERPLPTPGPQDIVVRVEASGLCGTDQHIAEGAYPLAQPGTILGHEFAGTVVEVGRDVRTWIRGDRVVIDPNIPCRTCRFCHDAKPHLCLNPDAIGVTIDGGLATFAACPATQAYRIPDTLPVAAAAITEPLACALHAVDRAHMRPGDTALVIGAGPIGLLCAALLQAAGASRVLVSELQASRRERILRFGGEPTAPENVPDGEADVVLECVGHPSTLAAALPAVRAGGTVVWVGVAPPNALVPVNPYDVFRRELTIRGTYTNPFTMDRALSLLSSGRIPWEDLITHRLPLDRFTEAWEAQTTGAGIKVLLEPN